MTAIISFAKWVLSWLSKGALDRAMDIIDKQVGNETRKLQIKADIVQAHLQTRAAFMQAGGFFLMVIFAVPLAVWWSAVIVYSIFWCANCVYPKDWTIAALPEPLNEWAGVMIIAVFGVVGVTRFVKR